MSDSLEFGAQECAPKIEPGIKRLEYASVLWIKTEPDYITNENILNADVEFITGKTWLPFPDVDGLKEYKADLAIPDFIDLKISGNLYGDTPAKRKVISDLSRHKFVLKITYQNDFKKIVGTKVSPMYFKSNQSQNADDDKFEITFFGDVRVQPAFFEGEDTIPPTVCEPVTVQLWNSLEEMISEEEFSAGSFHQITAPDADVQLKYADGSLFMEFTAPSNAVHEETIPDGTVNLKRVGGTLIESFGVKPGQTLNKTVANSGIILRNSALVDFDTFNVLAAAGTVRNVGDSFLSINDEPVMDIPAVSIANVYVKKDGVMVGTWDGIDTINVEVSDAWLRPTGWLPLDTVGTGTQNFSGLFAVYETQKNVCTIQLTFPSGTKTINWGDGTTASAVSGAVHTKVFDYATLSSPVLTDDFGYNYKMVVVNIPMTGTTQLYIDRNTTSTLINNGRSLNWLDVAVDCSTMTTFIVSNQGIANKLQRLLIYNVGATFDGSGYFQQLVHLKVLKFPFEKLQSTNITFINYFGDVKDENNNPINITLSINTGSLFNLFLNSLLTKIGNVSAPTSTSAQSIFENSLMLHSIGTVSMPLASNIVAMFSACINLESVVNITISSTCTNITNLGANARKCKGFIISNCAGITTTTNAFFGMVSMETLILTGMTRGFTIDDCNMSATAIDALFTSLGTASGSQTINVRRNPGSATCTTSIATAKGFTVVIA